MKSFSPSILSNLKLYPRPLNVVNGYIQKLVFSISFIILIGSALSANAQNISNPSFELFSAPCPTAQSQLKNKVTDWIALASPAAGTPDYFNTCGFNLSGYSTAISPQNGAGFAGTYAEANNTFNDYKEYLTTQLSAPLVAGVTYTFSFYVAHVYGASPAGFTPNTLTYTDLPVAEQGFLGAVFSTAAPVQTNTGNGSGGSPQYTSIRNDFGLGRALIPATKTAVYGAASRNTWVQVTLQYTAVGGETFMTMGQFRPGATTLPAGSSAYYLFDNFSASLAVVPNPGGVANPDFWVKSDDAGTISTAWKDNSANADHIANVGVMTLTPADRAHNFNPYTTGYTASKYFYNSSSLMNPTNGELANINTSIFSAVRPITAAAGRITGIDDDATNAAEPGVSITSTGRPRQYEFFNTATSTDFSTSFNVGQSNIFSAVANNNSNNGGTSASSGGEKIIGLNGTYETTLFTGTNKFQIYGRNLRVGHGVWDVNGAFPGDIMEVIWYKRTLTPNEQSRVNTYLALKNGVTLNENYISANSSTVWDRTINTNYNNNVFGIAKDNVSALHQKQAGSVNVNQKLVIGNSSSLFNTNAINTNDLTEGQFLIVGDNGLKQSLTTPLAYTGGTKGVTNFRFESIWKVQNTSSVGTVTVAWPKGVANLYLVQSTDAGFDTSDTFTSMATETTINGVVYNVTNVTLSNGQYFTFAGFGYSPGGVVTGLSYWYRADKNATNTGATSDVTGWTDVWNGTTVAQLGTNVLPKYIVGTSSYFNFNPGINFTAGTQTLGNNTVRTLTSLDYDVFTFTKEGIASGGTFGRLFSIGRDNTTTGITNWDAFGIWPYNTNLERRVYGGGTQYLPVAPAFSTIIPSIMYFKNTDTNTTKGLNGDVLQTPTDYNPIGSQLGGHIFGSTEFSSNGSDNPGFIGHVGETIVYGAGSLLAADRRKVDSYLAIKYGITLSQVAASHYLDADGSMVWNGGSNTVFNNNIFGVAREDIGLFEQKVSKSVNTGIILTVASTNNFINQNQDAARTGFVNDKTYFLLGDNNVTATPVVDITIAGTTWKRIQRAWLSQRKNTPNALYFEADLSTYGVSFGASSTVRMLVADDATFTTNVNSVTGTYANGKWVFSNNFNTDNAQRYITFAGLPPSYCVTGDCNTNTFLNTTNPNTIEYDNMVSNFHSTRMRDASTGAVMVWGDKMASNGSGDQVNPTEVNSANFIGLSGKILKFAGGSNGSEESQTVILTTTGLFAWGTEGTLISGGLTSTIAFQSLNVGTFGVSGGATKADGLPAGVSPTDVKMLFGSYQTLALTTCSGEVWVLAINGNTYGDNATDNTANDALWHRVRTNASTTLDDVVAIRGESTTLMALTATGQVYTWGLNTRLGEGSAALNRVFATQMTLPASVTPKMIGASGGTYYILGTNGNVYAMGSGIFRQLGNFTNSNSNTWVRVRKSATVGDFLTNVVWISPNEHDPNYPAINVLTADGRLWAWGSNETRMLGGGASSLIDPTQMPGSIAIGSTYNIGKLNWIDKVIAVETGGHTSMTIKENSYKYGYVGHRIDGSMADGSTVNQTENEYNFADTPMINLCGAPVGICTNPPNLAPATEFTKTGISDLEGFTGGTTGWPGNVPNGFIAIESKKSGFVITRVVNASDIANPVEGMLVYDITATCVKLYYGTSWKCLARDCTPLTN